MLNRYLKALKVPVREPSMNYLLELMRAQQEAFPYESVSKLVFLKQGKLRTPTLVEYLDSQQEFGFGGTCYSQNIYFAELLSHLGFQASSVGVVSNGNKNAHVCCLVTFNDETFSLDMGLMSMFTGPHSLTGPIVTQDEGFRSWKFIPGNGKTFSREMIRNGEVVRSFSFDGVEHQSPTLEDTAKESFNPGTIFMSNLCIFKVLGRKTVGIWNNECHIEKDGQRKSMTMSGAEEMESTLQTEFGLPNFPVREAISVLEGLTGKSIFANK